MESKILIAPEGELCVLVISGGGRVRFVISLVELQVSLSRGVTFTRFCFPFPSLVLSPPLFRVQGAPFQSVFSRDGQRGAWTAEKGRGGKGMDGVDDGWW